MYSNIFTHTANRSMHIFLLLLAIFYLIHSANNTKQGGKPIWKKNETEVTKWYYKAEEGWGEAVFFNWWILNMLFYEIKHR